jgi:hypothetical protein
LLRSNDFLSTNFVTFFTQRIGQFFISKRLKEPHLLTPPPQTEEGLSFVFSRYPAEQEQIPLENRVN